MRAREYDSAEKAVIVTKEDLAELLHEGVGPFYVYLLCYPPRGRFLDPFYVGIGQGGRIFSHEEEARRAEAEGRKVQAIRGIWHQGGDVVRVVDGVFREEPWQREEALINRFGLIKDGTGRLTNEQRYSPSHVEAGVELRKYAGDGNALPGNFIRRDTRLRVGPRLPANEDSVYGKICRTLADNPGVTGEELVELLLDVDFSANKSAYTTSGAVSRPWLAKYIDGGFYAKNRFIQEYEG